MDGAAILGRCNKETLKFMKKHFHKIIYVGLNPLDAEYDQVICDGNAVASDAVSHLIAQGHTQIGTRQCRRHNYPPEDPPFALS